MAEYRVQYELRINLEDETHNTYSENIDVDSLEIAKARTISPLYGNPPPAPMKLHNITITAPDGERHEILKDGLWVGRKGPSFLDKYTTGGEQPNLEGAVSD